MDPVIDEICRARDVQPHALRRWGSYLRTVVQPQLDELAARQAADVAPVATDEAARSRKDRAS